MEGRERAGERGSEERDQTDGGNYSETKSHYSETESHIMMRRSHYSETESLFSHSLSRWALACRLGGRAAHHRRGRAADQGGDVPQTKQGDVRQIIGGVCRGSEIGGRATVIEPGDVLRS